MSFASRALTQTETRYAQIEKELLSIVFACEKFDKYIFGRDVVHVETDHKPLEEIFKKSLCDAPARLQRMLLRLQRYNLDVRYKRGPLMHIADTLSRAEVAADICFHSGRNGPCFDLSEFAKFADQWNFQHVTSSPRHLQSNGKAENAVRTVKRLFTKCHAAGVSKFQALLDWRNTPSEGIDSSPAQRLLGHRCKTLLPTLGSLLAPDFSSTNEANKLRDRKERQRRYYNRGKRTLSPVKPGETVRVCSNTGTWKQAECLREVAPRSYDVQIDGAVLRCNRKDIWRTGEAQNLQTFEEPLAQCEQDAVIPPSASLPPNASLPSTVAEPRPSPVAEPAAPSAEPAAPSPVLEPTAPSSDAVLPTRRSNQQRRPPERFKDFVMS